MAILHGLWDGIAGREDSYSIGNCSTEQVTHFVSVGFKRLVLVTCLRY